MSYTVRSNPRRPGIWDVLKPGARSAADVHLSYDSEAAAREMASALNGEPAISVADGGTWVSASVWIEQPEEEDEDED